MKKENFIIALSGFNQIMKEIKQDFFIDSGTLLGYVREKGHINHTTDIDTATFKLTTNIEYEFNKRGWSTRHKYGTSGKGMEYSFYCPKTRIPIDIYELVYIPSDEINANESWCTNSFNGICNKMENKEAIYKTYLSKDLMKINIYGIDLLCTKDANDYCLRQYGKNYMIPDNFGYFDAIKNIKYKNLVERYDWKINVSNIIFSLESISSKINQQIFTTDNYFRIRGKFPSMYTNNSILDINIDNKLYITVLKKGYIKINNINYECCCNQNNRIYDIAITKNNDELIINYIILPEWDTVTIHPFKFRKSFKS